MTTSTMPRAVFAYVHHNRRVAALVTLSCVTDFALRTDPLQKLGNDLAMQAAAMSDLKVDAPWMHDQQRTVKDVISDVSRQLGEPVEIVQVHVQL